MPTTIGCGAALQEVAELVDLYEHTFDLVIDAPYGDCTSGSPGFGEFRDCDDTDPSIGPC